MPIRFLMYFPEKKGIIVNLPEIRGTADAATLSLSPSLSLLFLLLNYCRIKSKTQSRLKSRGSWMLSSNTKLQQMKRHSQLCRECSEA